MLNKKKNNKGFTLVELLVVIAIIGILAVVALPSLFSNIQKSKAAELESEYNGIRSASMAFYADNNVVAVGAKNGDTTTAQDGTSALKGYQEVFSEIEGLKSRGTGDATVYQSSLNGDYSLVTSSENSTPSPTNTWKSTLVITNADIESDSKAAQKLIKDIGSDKVHIVANGKLSTIYLQLIK